MSKDECIVAINKMLTEVMSDGQVEYIYHLIKQLFCEGAD